MNNIDIFMDNLIFADKDIVIIIPKKYEEQVLKKAFDSIKNEKFILLNISNDQNVEELTKNHGFF